MAAERLAMRDIKELFRLRLEKGLSQRQVAKAIGCGRTTVRDYERRAAGARLTYPEIASLPNDHLLLKLGLGTTCLSISNVISSKSRELPNWVDVHKEMSRKNVTLALLWTEYKEKNPAVSYTHLTLPTKA